MPKLNKPVMRYNWFWDLAAKWYFFPIIHILAALLLSAGNFRMLYLYFIFIPFGLIFLLGFALNSSYLLTSSPGIIFPILYYMLTGFLIYMAYHFKSKGNNIFKWLIAALFLLVIMSVAGAIYMLNSLIG